VNSLLILNIATGFFIGLLCNVTLWTGYYVFLGRLSTPDEKKVVFAIFYSFIAFNTKCADIINIVLYSYEYNSLYIFFVCYIVFLIVTSCIYFMLPNLEGYIPEEDPQENPFGRPTPIRISPTLTKKNRDVTDLKQLELSKHLRVVDNDKNDHKVESASPLLEEDHGNINTHPAFRKKSTLKQTVKTYWRLLNTRKYITLFPYLAQSGLFQGIIQGAIYRLVVKVFENDPKANDSYVKK